MCLWLEAGLTACGNDDPGQPEPDTVYIPSGAQESIVLENDASESLNAVKFETTGNWGVDIYETNSQYIVAQDTEKPNWIAMFPNKGGAGSWSCEILTSPNRNSSPRYAVITVSTAKNSVSFKVKQNGMPSGEGGGTILPNPGE